MRLGVPRNEGFRPHVGAVTETAARVWVNGHLRGDEASLSALDHGVTVGDGAFETLKIVDGRPFATRRHARRLDRSLTGLGLPAADHDVIASGVSAVLG